MKILIVGKFPPIQGGVSRETFRVANELVREGHEVDVVTNAEEILWGYRLSNLFTSNSFEANTTERLRIHNISAMNAASEHIPHSPAFESRLLGTALRISAKSKPDVIIGWYFLPYGIVAAQLSQILHRPLILIHAGSDLGAIATHPDLNATFRWMISTASAIVTSTNGEVPQRLKELGATDGQRFIPRSGMPLEPFFRQPPSCENLSRALAVAREIFDRYQLDPGTRAIFHKLTDDTKPLAPFTIGVYGKVGASKGTFDLFDALENLKNEGLNFTLIQSPSGDARDLAQFAKEIAARPALLDCVRLLPPMLPWEVPLFLRNCDAACFLERGFHISFHTPRIPREILSSGTCFVCSGEIKEKRVYKNLLKDRENCRIVSDPRMTTELADVLRELITDPETAKILGQAGRKTSLKLEALLSNTQKKISIVELVESFGIEPKFPPSLDAAHTHPI